MSHPINDEMLDNYRETLDSLREQREEFLEVAMELWLAYNSYPEDAQIRWLNGKFGALKECLDKLGGAK